MKQLLNTFVADDNTFTQLERTDKAALYERKTLEGVLVSYEVFAVKTKNDTEVYPQKNAFGKWAWNASSDAKANVLFDRLNEGVVTVMEVDPETGEAIRAENEQTYEQLMAEPDVTATNDVNETPFSLEDPTAPVVADEVKTEVQPTVESGVVATVTEVKPVKAVKPTKVKAVKVKSVKPAKVAKVKTPKVVVPKTKVALSMNIPVGEFTQAQFAVANNMPLRGSVWGRLDALKTEGKIQLVEMRKLGKGRATAIYSAVVVSAPVEATTEVVTPVTEVIAEVATVAIVNEPVLV